MNQSVSLDQLRLQMQTLDSDERRQKDKLFEIMGAKKVVQFMIDEISKTGDIAPVNGVNHNG